MPNVLATVVDTCRTCGNSRLVQPTKTGRVCKACHNRAISKVPRKYAKNRACAHCGETFVITHPQQKWCVICGPDATAKGRLKRYDMSQPEFEEQKKRQGHLCAVCRIKPPTAVDHNHRTTQNRGLVCYGCNHGLAFMEDPEWRKRAEHYLQEYQPKSEVG
jgi:hypothetical protein